MRKELYDERERNRCGEDEGRGKRLDGARKKQGRGEGEIGLLGGDCTGRDGEKGRAGKGGEGKSRVRKQEKRKKGIRVDRVETLQGKNQ